MTKRKKIRPKDVFFLFPLVVGLPIALTPTHPEVAYVSLPVGFAWVGWMMWDLFTDGKSKAVRLEERRVRELEAIRHRTAELEADLGYEPLNLHELDGLYRER